MQKVTSYPKSGGGGGVGRPRDCSPSHDLFTSTNREPNSKRWGDGSDLFSNLGFIKFCRRLAFFQFSTDDLGSLMVQDNGVHFVS